MWNCHILSLSCQHGNGFLYLSSLEYKTSLYIEDISLSQFLSMLIICKIWVNEIHRLKTCFFMVSDTIL